MYIIRRSSSIPIPPKRRATFQVDPKIIGIGPMRMTPPVCMFFCVCGVSF